MLFSVFFCSVLRKVYLIHMVIMLLSLLYSPYFKTYKTCLFAVRVAIHDFHKERLLVLIAILNYLDQ